MCFLQKIRKTEVDTKCHKKFLKPNNNKQTKQTQKHHKAGGATKTTITRVQGNKREVADGYSSLNVSLDYTPTDGNMLIAVIGTFASWPPYVDTITQTNVTWTKQVSSDSSSYYGRNVEIWAGTVAANASETLTITLKSSGSGPDAYPVIADVCEYSGVATSNFLDKTAIVDGNHTTTLLTGSTYETGYDEELWIGGIFNVCDLNNGDSDSSPTNGFALLDGVGFTDGKTTSLAYLENIVSSTGVASSGVTGGSYSDCEAYVGCIATFKAAGSNFVNPIVRVQGNARGTSTGSDTCVVELDNAPQKDNVLIACIGTDAGTVDSISQTGVEWNQQVNSIENSYGYRDSEIWLGVIGSGASKEITITLTSTASDFVANVCEYSGIDTNTPLDQTQTDSGFGSVTPNTGMTAPTGYSNELWIGTCASDATLSNASDQFYLFDGEVNSTVSVAYLEKKMSQTAQAHCELEPINGIFAGCVATFSAVIPTVEFKNIIVDETAELTDLIVDETAEIFHLRVDGVAEINSANMNYALIDGFLQANTGISTSGNFTVSKASPNINLNAVTGNIDIFFKQNTTPKMSLSYWTNVNQLGVYDNVGSKGLLSLDHDGVLNLQSGELLLNKGAHIINDAAHLSYSYAVLPTQAFTGSYCAYPSTGYGNILFEHTGSQYSYPAGKKASLFLVMVEAPTGGYAPFIATDEGLFVEKDLQTYGALFTASDPSKGYGGGAVMMGHGFTGVGEFEVSCPPCIVLADYETGFDTLHIYKSAYSRTLGHLRADYVHADQIRIEGELNIQQLLWTSYNGPLYADVYGYIGSSSSSIRGKENVRELLDCAWVYDLRPVSFDWKDQKRAKEEGTRMGLIAEEVNDICSKLTWLDKEGKPEGVHYEWLGVPLLVEMKKLRNHVEALEKQLKSKTAA